MKTLAEDARALLARLRQSPEDTDTWCVLADWLTDKGDERGALIAAGESAMADISSEITSLGGEILERSHLAGTLVVRIPADGLATLAGRSDVAAIDVWVPPDIDAGYAMTVQGNLDGIERLDLLQARPLHQSDYKGEPAELIGIIEPDGDQARNTPVSFNDSLGSRRLFRCGGTGSTCTDSTITNGVAHVTDVSSTILSDIRNGQDSSITNATQRAERSGIAPFASGLAMDTSDIGRVVDIMTGSDPSFDDIYIVNHSAANTYPPNIADDPDCEGTTSSSQNFNEMFEAGVAVFNSNGNNGHSDSAECNVGSPATAIGVFAVGAYYVGTNSPYDELLHSATSRGGGGSTVHPRPGPLPGRDRTGDGEATRRSRWNKKKSARW